jgi:hypothetical protein
MHERRGRAARGPLGSRTWLRSSLMGRGPRSGTWSTNLYAVHDRGEPSRTGDTPGARRGNSSIGGPSGVRGRVSGSEQAVLVLRRGGGAGRTAGPFGSESSGCAAPLDVASCTLDGGRVGGRRARSVAVGNPRRLRRSALVAGALPLISCLLGQQVVSVWAGTGQEPRAWSASGSLPRCGVS